MLNIVIPAAGNGTRFKEAGYIQEKPDIPVLGAPMIDRVIENVKPKHGDSRVFVIRRRNLESPSAGAVDTILRVDIPMAQPLIIANCDQLVRFDVSDFKRAPKDMHARIVTFKSNKPHHSYVKVDDGIIKSIKEKEVISNHAVAGVYYFRHGGDFVQNAKYVMAHNIKVNQEYYVSSVIAEMVKRGYRIGIYEAPTAILGTPEELQLFEMAAEVAKSL